MILTLEVTGEQAAELGAGCRRVFDSTGGIAVSIEQDTDERKANLGWRPAVVADDHATEWFGLNEMLTPLKAAQSRRARPEALRPAAALQAAPERQARFAVPARPAESAPPVRSIANSTSRGDAAPMRELLAAAAIEGVEPSSDLVRTCKPRRR